MSKLPTKQNNWNLIRFCLYNFLNYVGINVCLVLFGWIVVDRGGSATVVATYASTTVLVSIITAAMAGPIVDRTNNFIVLKVICGVQFAAVATYVLLIHIFPFSFIFLFLLGSISGASITIYNTASRGTITSVLRKDQLVLGNSLLEICIQAGAIIASLGSGIVYKVFGETSMMILTALFFLVGGIFIYVLPIAKDQSTANYWTSLKSGYEYAFNNRVVFLLGLTLVFSVLSTLLSNTVLPLYVSHYLHQDSIVFGLTDTMFGVGALLGGIYLSRFTNSKYTMFYLVSTVSLALLIFNKSVVLLVVMYIVYGMSNTILKIALNAKLMEIVSEKFYGQTTMMFNNMQSVFQIVTTFLMAKVISFGQASSGYAVLITVILISFVLYQNVKKRLA